MVNKAPLGNLPRFLVSFSIQAHRMMEKGVILPRQVSVKRLRKNYLFELFKEYPAGRICADQVFHYSFRRLS
jgi:hypothetical protein